MPFGDVLAQGKPIPLRTADGVAATVGGSWLQNLVLRIVGIPHLGMRVRARAVVSALKNRPGEEVLDAGCGPGVTSLTLSQQGYKVTAIDTDPAKIEILRLLGLSLGRNLAAQIATVCDLPFRDASFDKVLCAEVLEHVEDDRRAVAELARVLRPGGVLVITVPSKHSIAHAYEDDFGHARPGYTPESLLSLLREQGLFSLSWRTYLHSRFGEWAWQTNHRLFRSRVSTVASFYPLFWASLLFDRLLPADKPGLGYVAVARREVRSRPLA
jgi:SAM-dependent methyltransferase